MAFPQGARICDQVPAHRLLLAGLYAVGRIKRRIAGVRPYHVRELGVHGDTLLELSLDGEVSGDTAGRFCGGQ